METRAPYAIIGLFVLAASAPASASYTGSRYRRPWRTAGLPRSVRYIGLGLLVGASVLFNGIRVGEVTG